MKPILLYVSGIITGLVVALLIPSEESKKTVQPPQVIENETEETRLWSPKSRKSHSFSYHEPVFLVTRSGEEYRLYISGSTGTPLLYQWHSSSNHRINGRGKLFENYSEVSRSSEGVHVVDDGSELVIMIDGYRLEWSPRDRLSGWLYYDASELSIGRKSS